MQAPLLQRGGSVASTSGSVSTTTARAFAFPAGARRAVLCRAKDSGPGIGEDVLARLRAAEEEAARLRKELAAAQSTKLGDTPDVVEGPKPRVDGTGNRETIDGIFTGNKQRGAWLSEKDVDFFTGGGPGEAAAEPEDPEAAATVQRRLLIGGLLSAGFLAFALVPTETLVIKPSKPMYFYVVPLLRIQALLADSKQIIDDAEWDQLRLVVSRVKGAPNNARDNLDAVVALIEDARESEKARAIAAEFMEYLESMDFDTYFDAMAAKRKNVLSGTQNAQFVEFSTKALKAAQQRLTAFLAMLPADVISQAQAQIASAYE